MKTILAVDDEITNLSIVEGLLEEEYHVIPVTTGQMALNYLDKNDADLILLDILMPGMNGFEVMENLRKNEKTAEIPVIFLTAQSTPDIESKCFDLGAQDFIAKPFDARIVLRRVKRTLERSIGTLNSERDLLLQARKLNDTAHEDTQTEQSGQARWLTAQRDNVEVKVCVSDIIYVEVYDHVCMIRTQKGDFKSWTPLKKIEDEIGTRFVRTGQSFLVNVDKIVELGDDYIIMENRTEIKLPRRSKKEIRQQIQEKKSNQ